MAAVKARVIGPAAALFLIAFTANFFWTGNRRISDLISLLSCNKSVPTLFPFSNPPRLVNPQRNSTKFILLWTEFFRDPLWEAFFKQDASVELKPHGKRCSFLPANQLRVDEADAVVFHATDIQLDAIPHAYRTPQQYWIYFSLESPVNLPFKSDEDYEKINQLQFNWTMTYSRKSDVWFPYGKFQLFKMDETIAARISAFQNSFPRRKKDAVWIASNCITTSHRELLVQKLKRSGVTIDIIGKCGGKMSIESISEFDFSDYRFYLAFENSLCEDYMTEKLFQAYDASLRYGVIPVVYGGASYSELLPPNSFIDIFSFKNIIQLANYLKSLRKERNPQLASFYQWHFSYKLHDYQRNFSSKTYTPREGWRTLCEKLWSNNGKKIGSAAVNDVRLSSGSCRQLDFKNSSFFNFTALEFFAESTYLDSVIKAVMKQPINGSTGDTPMVDPRWVEFIKAISKY